MQDEAFQSSVLKLGVEGRGDVTLEATGTIELDVREL